MLDSNSEVNTQVASSKNSCAAHDCLHWLSFPAHENWLGAGDITAVERLETRSRQLDAISKDGNPAERTRARLAKVAYERTRDLLLIILQTREEMVRNRKKE
jgi:hypothetical protein